MSFLNLFMRAASGSLFLFGTVIIDNISLSSSIYCAMAYDITIGNKVFEEFDGSPEGGYWTVDRLVMPEAPLFPNDHMTGRSNMRSPSYRGWDEFIEATELGELFDELMAHESGNCVDLTETHLVAVKGAVSRWKDLHPGTTPGFTRSLDPQLARLLWLEWWMDWALKNCEHPAFDWC
jgi:hypothetical protein